MYQRRRRLGEAAAAREETRDFDAEPPRGRFEDARAAPRLANPFAKLELSKLEADDLLLIAIIVLLLYREEDEWELLIALALLLIGI